MKLKNPEKQKLADKRDAEMAAKGFVPVDEAARLACTVRSNIYTWIRIGKLRSMKWGLGRGSVYVARADLNVPEAVAPRKPAPRAAKKKAKRAA